MSMGKFQWRLFMKIPELKQSDLPPGLELSDFCGDFPDCTGDDIKLISGWRLSLRRARLRIYGWTHRSRERMLPPVDLPGVGRVYPAAWNKDLSKVSELKLYRSRFNRFRGTRPLPLYGKADSPLMHMAEDVIDALSQPYWQEKVNAEWSSLARKCEGLPRRYPDPLCGGAFVFPGMGRRWWTLCRFPDEEILYLYRKKAEQKAAYRGHRDDIICREFSPQTPFRVGETVFI